MDEVEAISDGTSLHRRLAVPMAGDEMARLALTVNGMLARLEQSFASLHRFTADASHELKTPLMVLRAGVERALVHPGVPGEILQSLDETLAQINEMTELVESLLTLARADEGRAPLAVEESDLRDLMGDVLETAGMLGEGVDVASPAGCPTIPCAWRWIAQRIREMLLNLVTNAIKYTPQGGAIDLRLSEQDGAVTSPCGTPASASRLGICRTSSSGSGAPTRPAPGPATVPGPASAWPSPSGSPRRTAARSPCRAGRDAAPSSRCGCRGRRRRSPFAESP